MFFSFKNNKHCLYDYSKYVYIFGGQLVYIRLKRLKVIIFLKIRGKTMIVQKPFMEKKKKVSAKSTEATTKKEGRVKADPRNVLSNLCVPTSIL